MAHSLKSLQAIVESAGFPELELRFRPMFGGIGVYSRGRMFCSLSDVGMALKLSGDEHAALLRMRGAKPLQYDASVPPSKSYVVVPTSMLKQRPTLSMWIERSATSARAAPAKKPRKKSRTAIR
jgi:TfoX/Sxy family transcriptional regulator of competence genes